MTAEKSQSDAVPGTAETGTEAVQIRREGSVARVVMCRPRIHNAFDDHMIAALAAALRDVGGRPEIRVVILQSEGKSFSAGADLNWMRSMADYSYDENLADAHALAGLMQTLNNLPKPTIARVQGAAMGGGVGLVACCDIAVASTRAKFALSEVKLGLVPAVISPYVVQAIGPRSARRYFMTGEAFDAHEAHRLGLVHEVVASGSDGDEAVDALDDAVDQLAATLAGNGPSALAAAKHLVAAVADRDPSTVIDLTARRIADIRASDEGREGVSAFLEKRPPEWRVSDHDRASET
jgi:methylglutaconyl-CoA hydratase